MKKRRNTNYKMVTVRGDRQCKMCGETIQKGTKCLTINIKYEGRKYLCHKCIKAMKDYKKAKEDCDSVPFDDEGAGYVYQDLLSDAESNLLTRKMMGEEA